MQTTKNLSQYYNKETQKAKEEYADRLNQFLKAQCKNNFKSIYTIFEKIYQAIPSSEFKEENQDFQDLQALKSAIMGGIDFYDNEYPPDADNLQLIKEIYPQLPTIVWKKVRDLVNIDKFPVFQLLRLRTAYQPEAPYIPPLAIPSALSCLTTQPSLILRIIPFKKANPSGIYPIWLFLKDGWTSVTVDDHIPVLAGEDNDTGARMIGMDLFESGLCFKLIEKAFAKICGGYQNIAGVEVEDVLRALTGGIINVYDIPERLGVNELTVVEDIWTNMAKALIKGYVMTAEPRQLLRNTDPKGLTLNHNYTIVKLAKLREDIDKEEETHLLLMRSPFKDDKWSGEWSESSNKWTGQLREMLAHNKRAGDFWMNYGDFLKFFKKVSICKVVPGNSYVSVPVTCNQKGIARIAFKMSITQFKEYNLTLSQSSNIGKVKLTLGKFHEGDYRFLGYTNSEGQSCCSLCTKSLIYGEYFILVEVNIGNFEEEVGDLCLTINGPGPVGLKVMENEEQSVVYDFLYQKVMSYYSKRVEGEPISSFRLSQAPKDSVMTVEKHDIPGSTIVSLVNRDVYGVEMRVDFLKCLGSMPEYQHIPEKTEIMEFDNDDERIVAEVQRESFPRLFDILGPSGNLKRTHMVKIDPGDKETFILRNKTETCDRNESDIKFVLGCTHPNWYQPDEPTSYQRVLEEKKKIIQDDNQLYKALSSEFVPKIWSNLDRRQGEHLERLVKMNESEVSQNRAQDLQMGKYVKIIIFNSFFRQLKNILTWNLL